MTTSNLMLHLQHPLCEWSKTCNTLEFRSFSIVYNEVLTLPTSFHILYLIASYNSHGLQIWLHWPVPHRVEAKKRFFHHSPSVRRSLVVYHRSSLKLSTTTTSFASLSRGSLNEAPLPPTCSLPSTDCPPPSNKGNLEESSTTTTIGPSLLLFLCECGVHWVYSLCGF